MAEFLGQDGSADDASPTFPRQPQAGDLREEVGRSAPVGWGPDLQEEVPHAGEPEAGQRGGQQNQEARLSVLPAQDGALPDWAVSQLDEEPIHPTMLVCRSRTQTRDHLFKECPEWKPQQKILWVEVKKETGRWKDRWKVRDLLADGRCSRAALDFLSSTDVGAV